MALTSTDLKQIREVIHKETKVLLEPYATKEDLKRFATKEDLLFFASKEDLITVKDELNSKFNEVMNAIDHVIKELQEMRQEHESIRYRVYKVHQPMLDDHDHRLASLTS